MKFYQLFAFIAFVLLFTNNLLAQTNKKLIAQLDTIYQSDQQYRSKAMQEAGKNNPELDKANMDKQAVADRANLAKIEKIFAQYGYPGKTMVGEKYQSVAFMVIQHNDQEAQEKYLPLLTGAANKGEFRATSLAILIDRVKMGRGEKQVYGSQMHETKDGVKIYPIEDEPNVDIRRAKIGLPPLALYVKTWNIDYHVPTAEKPNPASMYYVQEERHESPVEAVGGTAAIYAQLNYPDKAKENNITGFVTVQLTIDKDGNTKNVEVIKSLGYGCDEEALRVMKAVKYTNKTGEDNDIRVKLPFPYKKK
ncbi:energy transducer TonB [Mucilaginibacter gilvus]|uniref:Energy transducer TonB n=1 Tax=Mucilaginibacter gilvus TaxID=2305909 RepID=A0A444MSP2_9SPHI|nr:energy transducer TonB [Mucilaginibacter gilvus]RWY55631.1 energy transducer TonB [Mucilaginibacter gilvus]